MSAAASQMRGVTQITRGLSSKLSGRGRGPDRAVRRNSYDVDDPKAKPWAKIGTGTVAEGLAHREALLDTARDRYHQDWKEMPAARVREKRAELAGMEAELAAAQGNAAAPTGVAAALRIAIGRSQAWLKRASMRLRRVDITVLAAVLRSIDFATGAMFPALDTIAHEAGCHRNTAIGALARLKAAGFIDWVRRSIRTGAEGTFGPQREQTSNAYFFDHRRQMPSRTWSRFWQLLTAKLRRAGSKATGASQTPPSPPTRDVQEQRDALARLASKIDNAST